MAAWGRLLTPTRLQCMATEGCGAGAVSQPLPIRPPCCRQRLSNDAFSSFLQAIKELNSGKLTRSDTLQRARDIFGSTNKELYGVHTLSIAATLVCGSAAPAVTGCWPRAPCCCLCFPAGAATQL